MRIERDSLGDVEVPDDALYGAQTARAVANFPISGQPVPIEVIHALGDLKAVAAHVNAELGVISHEKGDAIQHAGLSTAAGRFDDHFPVDVFQTGSGTSTNMNVNEVIAHVAARDYGIEIHPNDDVNAGQSSNDVFPSAVRIAATASALHTLVPALGRLEEALAAKESEFADIVKAGRTHLMDAVPVTLGQEFGGYRRQIELGRERVAHAARATAELPLGGTATGTGLNAAPGFAAEVIRILGERLGLPLREAANHFEAQSAQDALVELHAAYKVVAVSLTKICNDLRWMGSGPHTGLAEIRLPDLQPGSSIMPGKVNPVIPEATLMVCAQVIGNDVTVTTAGASGNFELNVMLPVLARNVLESGRLLAATTRLLADRCIDGIEPNVEQMAAYAATSPSLATGLNQWLGYDEVAAIVKESTATGRTIREVVVDRGHLASGRITADRLDAALDPRRLT